jgi:hypothetical protein
MSQAHDDDRLDNVVPISTRLRQADGEFTMELPGLPGHRITGESEEHVLRAVDQLTVQAIKRTQWPPDNYAAMSALGRLFPSMVRFDGSTVPGIEPWDPQALVHWLNTSGEPTSGSRQAALFLLSVWNREDWRGFGLKVRRGSQRIGRFDINDGFASWDGPHRRAALAWFANPFWP